MSTPTRTRVPHRFHLPTILVLSSIVGVLAGLAVTATEPIPGLPVPDELVRVGLPIVRVLLDMAAVVTVGLCLLPILIGFDRPKLAEPLLAGVRRIGVAAPLVWTVTAFIALVLQTAELYPGEEVSAGAVADYVDAVGAGKALVFVIVAALLCTALGALTVRFGEQVPAELRTAVAMLALLPLPVTGHATNWRWHDFTMISMELHVMSAVAWTGGLGAVVVLLAGNRTLLACALPRFSKLATGCLLMVTATGLFNGIVELTVAPGVSFVDALFGDGYGLLVLIKTVCVVGLAALGATIRWRLMPAIVAHGRTALIGWAAMELAVMGVAFGIAVVLTRTPV